MFYILFLWGWRVRVKSRIPRNDFFFPETTWISWSDQNYCIFTKRPNKSRPWGCRYTCTTCTNTIKYTHIDLNLHLYLHIHIHPSGEIFALFNQTYVSPHRQADLAIWYSCDFGRPIWGPLFLLPVSLHSFCFWKRNLWGIRMDGKKPWALRSACSFVRTM